MSDDACYTCGKPIVCLICDTCEDHCLTEGGPDACWEAHERWRTTGKDDSLAGVTISVKPIGIGPAPKPRWRS